MQPFLSIGRASAAPRTRRVTRWLACALLLACGDTRRDAATREGPLVVFSAGSLARPLRAALEAFQSETGIAYQLESAGSLETARKLTELNKIPDLVALADEEVFPKLLIPAYTAEHVVFARNRLVLAHTPGSRFAEEVTADNWWSILQRPGVQTGRSNPDLDPSGYRTLMVWQLAELHYGQPGLAAALEAAAPPRNMRPKEIELVALLEAHELDYAWFYESMARAAGLPYIRLPQTIDLSSPADSASYGRAVVRVLGRAPGDTLILRGAPIRYAYAVPTQAPHPDLGRRFAAFLASQAGKRALASEYLEVVERE
ncbi:MAG TPA: extracellular solute-binding protein [Gemmatimonadaceae bacterium]|nr:extracellular solute-binding protein [Gemmatimonadaceae bacterium]